MRRYCYLAILVPIGIAHAGEPLTQTDKFIRTYLSEQAAELERTFLPSIKIKEDFEKVRTEMRETYLDMQGLWPLPAKTPLNAKTTGRIDDKPDYSVEMVHFQSKPGLYVTTNLFLPKPLNGKYPAILYQSGHSNEKRDGNKTAYQDWGVWFARHGYVCLVTDTLQLGEIPGIHHGTYREGRWWWHSLGYTSAGVECWNAIRALDYLETRPEVDAQRLGATGISGGGSATMWIAAADERIKAAAPVSGMADLGFYVSKDGVNGHCDCMFIYNRARWNWTNIPALICPRPLLFVNSDNDTIFPMSANNRIINRLEWLYARYGAGDKVDAVVSVGGHGYRSDLRREVFEFFNRHFKRDANPVTDGDSGLKTVDGDKGTHWIEHSALRVFPTDADIPTDAINGHADRTFISPARVELPTADNFATWRTDLLQRLRSASFNAWPKNIDFVEPIAPGRTGFYATENGVASTAASILGKSKDALPWLIVLNPDDNAYKIPAWAEPLVGDATVLLISPRGSGPRAWTKKNPPNTVEREMVLIGATVDSGRVWDIMNMAKRHAEPGKKWHAAGSGQAGILAAYAALYEESIGAVTAVNPPSSHMPVEGEAQYGPPLLNVLRVLDIPDAMGCLAPRPLHLKNAGAAFDKTAAIYKAAGAEDKLKRN